MTAWVAGLAILLALGACALVFAWWERLRRRRVYDEKVGLTLEGLVALLPPDLRNRGYTSFMIGPSEGPITVGLLYDDGTSWRGNPPNVGLTFDAETGVLLRIHEGGVGLGLK